MQWSIWVMCVAVTNGPSRVDVEVTLEVQYSARWGG